MNNIFSPIKIFLSLLIIGVLANLALLNYTSFFKTEKVLENITKTEVAPSPNVSLTVCPQACLDLISSPAAEVKEEEVEVEAEKKDQQTMVQNLVREIFIPLGSGQFQGSDWQLLSGTKTTIDSRLYKGIKTVFLQASLSIPDSAGEIEVNLFNVTDGYEVWGSYLKGSGADLNMVSSTGFELPQGQKDYQLKVRSSIGSPAIVGLARLRIVLE
jgi:hypothetical protein